MHTLARGKHGAGYVLEEGITNNRRTETATSTAAARALRPTNAEAETPLSPTAQTTEVPPRHNEKLGRNHTRWMSKEVMVVVGVSKPQTLDRSYIRLHDN
ncbi:hypothetical protein PTSG_06483 [Salpingoeca rosetta]|uniref:Uncharacterized protein n=1 Tax=Salpingoeca rosetta (strain ATCC 50818 / BSB-021) TaxID=946362 RepID=F2UFY0_SALR5|nr:uncharacterized protein PTSG_06483 [Salpingoeca rosetta]EGD75408.1 hypothetical protein PTSG_06483 [Salpingoeca rosetta]|eukprot:XP_004991865.1 hypothetical protein PTSG_06483 [Salpingoeca rosetta]